MTNDGMTNPQCPTGGWAHAGSAPRAAEIMVESRRSLNYLVIGHLSSLFIHSVRIVLFGVLIVGCAGYHLGPTNGLHAGERSVQVNSFVNQTIEPRLSDALSLSLRKNLQKDGTYRLNTHNEGDIILSGTIVNYDR